MNLKESVKSFSIDSIRFWNCSIGEYKNYNVNMVEFDIEITDVFYKVELLSSLNVNVDEVKKSIIIDITL